MGVGTLRLESVPLEEQNHATLILSMDRGLVARGGIALGEGKMQEVQRVGAYLDILAMEHCHLLFVLIEEGIYDKEPRRLKIRKRAQRGRSLPQILVGYLLRHSRMRVRVDRFPECP